MLQALRNLMRDNWVAILGWIVLMVLGLSWQALAEVWFKPVRMFGFIFILLGIIAAVDARYRAELLIAISIVAMVFTLNKCATVQGKMGTPPAIWCFLWHFAGFAAAFLVGRGTLQLDRWHAGMKHDGSS